MSETDQEVRDRLGIPTWRTKITMRGGQEFVSSESYEDLSARLRQYVHQHMPVQVIRGMTTQEIMLDRQRVETMEDIEPRQ